jgi:hypothetical protein
MSTKIKIKRNTLANIGTLDVGEPYLATDTFDLYLGTSAGNKQIAGVVVLDTRYLKLSGGTMTSDLKLGTAGNGLYIKEGTNATMGVVTLVLGVATVSTTKVTANSRIFLTTQGGTLTNIANHYVSGRTAGTSFTITSMNLLDTSDVAWLIVEPA